MAEVFRVTPQEIREKVSSGEVLLVCAYESEEKFVQYHLEGAISLPVFKAMIAGLPKTREIVFYCN